MGRRSRKPSPPEAVEAAAVPAPGAPAPILDWRRFQGRPLRVNEGPFVCEICRLPIINGQIHRRTRVGQNVLRVHEDCAGPWCEAQNKLGALRDVKTAHRRRRVVKDLSGLPEAMGKLKSENDEKYRCFLLWAMQHPDLRATTHVARATARNMNTVRRWSREYGWAERVKGLPRSDAVAVDVYRRLFWAGPHAVREIPEVADYVRVPLGHPSPSTSLPPDPSRPVSATDGVPPLSPSPGSVVSGAAMAVVPEEDVRPPGDPKARADDVAAAIARRRAHRLTVREAYARVANDALGHIATAIASGKARVAVSDLPSLYRFQRELEADEDTARLAADEVRSSGPTISESFRVKRARSTGGDVIEAVWEDLQEVGTIVSALRTARAAGRDVSVETIRPVIDASELEEPGEEPG